MKTASIARFAALLLSVVAMTAKGSLSGYEFTGSGISAGYAVSADAKFIVSTGKVVLTLTNTTPHTNDAGQLLTGVTFTLSNGGTEIYNAGLTGATAIPRTINADGTYTDGSLVNLMSPATWEETSSGGTYQLDFNPNAQFAIVGMADGETSKVAGSYTFANGSIVDNSGHNPFTAQVGTFTLTSASILSGTKITGVSFIYNTALSYSVPGIALAPESSSFGVFGLGLVAVCAVSRFRGFHRAAQPMLA